MGGSAANPYKYQNLWRILRVGPSDTYDDWTFHDVVEGDVRSEFHVEAEWNADKSFIARIFETADPADGIDSEKEQSFAVSPGLTGHWEGLKLYNDDDDSVEIWFDATNEIQIT